MRLFTRDKPKIKVESSKADGFSGWLKCTECTEMIHTSELTKNRNCCPKCDHHYRLHAKERVATLADEGTYQELFTELKPVDALEFVDTKPYPKRLKAAKESSGNTDAVRTGVCEIEGQSCALGVLDFSFMAGSMGSVVGEKLTRLIELALEKELPLIIVSASGGARMQESILSLMQMAKTSAALAKLHEAKIPFISVLTNPTSGGVTASFASLGDIIIAEPKALICFAGPRVVEQVIGQTLPPGAQRSEFLLEHGMVDCIISRKKLKSKLALFIAFLTNNKKGQTKQKRKKAKSRLKELYLLTDHTD